MTPKVYISDERLRALLKTAKRLNEATREDDWPLAELAERANVDKRSARQLMTKARNNTFAGGGYNRGRIIFHTQTGQVYYETKT